MTVEPAAGPAEPLRPGDQPVPARDDRNWMLSPDQQARLEAAIVEWLLPSLAAILDRPEAETAARATEATADFFPLYRGRPIRNNKGGGLINDSLCLYLVARLLQPATIVESGSYQGHSAWLLRQACPAAEIVTFDVRPEQLRHREPDIDYRAGDWSEAALPAFDPARTLVWFDDHISHARRLVEARRRGFRHALFDDNFDAYSLYATGGAPVPTLAMTIDRGLADGEEIVWMRHGKTYRYRVDGAACSAARAAIEAYHPLPDLSPITRYSPASGMTYARIAP
ncbi:hypothetical protein [Tistlia consotensis]|uniref:hypothetical protein n=1 Tax=Tistlia consotensis TaxID=1321365 RepID=UPI00117FA1BD|nr:hypothetical protein [Tistlia consotensis]